MDHGALIKMTNYSHQPYNITYSLGEMMDEIKYTGTPKTVTRDGPLKSAFESDTQGVIRQEFITYRLRSGNLYRETTSRVFSSNGDYQDSSDSVFIGDRGSAI